MQRFAAPWIHGYPSFVALICNYALQLGEKIPARWVTLGAENVLAQQSDAITTATSVRPIQHYGMAEAAANISQCPSGRLHVDEDFAATEFIPRGDNAYSVVGTSFSNPAFPLIRYQVGDLVMIGGADGAAPTCDCGRAGRVVSAIDGRQEDYIVTANGTRIGRLDHVFKDMVHVREAQLVQEQAGAMTVRRPRPQLDRGRRTPASRRNRQARRRRSRIRHCLCRIAAAHRAREAPLCC